MNSGESLFVTMYPAKIQGSKFKTILFIIAENFHGGTHH